jgi:hypothetical protein
VTTTTGAATTTTGAVTTTTGAATTTTTSPSATSLQFSTAVPGGTCGSSTDASSTVIKNLSCGGLNIGGGLAGVPEGSIPDGSISKFTVSCTGSSCTIGPFSTAPPVNTSDPDCTDVGCNFGTPLPIPNPGLPALSTCVLNTWSAAASGTLDLSSGASSTNVALNSDVYLTGNVNQPCPKCVAEACDRGPRAGMACTSTSATGYTRDCPTGGSSGATTCGPAHNQPCTCAPGGGFCLDGSHVGVIPISLSPLETATRSLAADATGLFCPNQNNPGCFGSGTCVTITENGKAAGPVSPGTAATATLASVFCIPSTGNGSIDAVADLPGPGAIALPGSFLVQ